MIEEAIKNLKDILAEVTETDDSVCYITSSDADTLKMAIQALEQELKGDTISRQAVLDQTYLWSKDEFLRVTNPFDYLRKRVNSLPPVTIRQNCEYRHENGNCLKVGGFCTSVDDEHCMKGYK